MRRHLLASILLAACATQAHAAPIHVHGAGSLDVVIDKGQITIALELPLDAAVGFERAPKSARENASLAATAKVLGDASALFMPTLAAHCTVQSVGVTVPFLAGAPAHTGEHTDIEANYVFRCTEPAALRGIETTIFKSFKRLYRLEVQRAGPAGQGAARLSPKQPLLRW